MRRLEAQVKDVEALQKDRDAHDQKLREVRRRQPQSVKTPAQATLDGPEAIWSQGREDGVAVDADGGEEPDVLVGYAVGVAEREGAEIVVSIEPGRR